MPTRREEIISLLKDDKWSAQELANFFKVELWEITEDLKHVGKTVYPKLKMKPALCKQCGFVFKDRGKIKKPSKCPKCKHESIEAPMFWID